MADSTVSSFQLIGRSNGTNPYEFSLPAVLSPLGFLLGFETVEDTDLRRENDPNRGLNWMEKVGLGLGF